MTGMTRIEGPSAWVGCSLHPEDYRVELSAACHDEIRRAVDELRAFPLPTIVLRPEDFAMPACREQMARVRHILERGARFAIVGSGNARSSSTARRISSWQAAESSTR